MKNRQKNLGLILSLILFACFFAPWSKIANFPGTPDLSGSGFELAINPEIQGTALFVLPILCFVVILTSFVPWNNRWLQVLTGLTPLAVATAGLIYGSNEMSTKMMDLIPVIRPFIDWGVYATLGVGFLLFVNGLIGKKRPS